jgi:hypothetical protein
VALRADLRRHRPIGGEAALGLPWQPEPWHLAHPLPCRMEGRCSVSHIVARGEDIQMCGRFTFQPTEAIYERFRISNRLDSLMARYNIAPGQMVPVIIANSPRRIVCMRWGLTPHWAKDQKTAYKMINARIETLTQRPAFRGLLSHNRALVPACGYYEWKAEGRDKTP